MNNNIMLNLSILILLTLWVNQLMAQIGSTYPNILVSSLNSTAVTQYSQPLHFPQPSILQSYQPPTLLKITVFGEQLFTGRFGTEQFTGFNPDYQISIGDKITIHIWGPIIVKETLTVDPQGNIFIPYVGPVKVLGVRNGELNSVVERQVKRVFKEHTGVYAVLETSVPVKVYVTGYVRNPGLYGGLSGNSILYFIDRAGGIDPERGSFIDVKVLRGGKLRWQYNLYDFLLNGHIDLIQMSDGDTIFVGPKKRVFQVTGEVYNPYQFEFQGESISLAKVFELARPKPGATHVAITRKRGLERVTEYYSIEEASNITIYDGDEINVLSDRYPGTIYVRLEGAHSGPRALILPYGARLKDALSRVVANEKSNLSAVQLFRKSVAQRQKEMLLQSLRQLQTFAFTGRAETREEAELRAKEAELIARFIDTAKNIEPKGQVVIEDLISAENMLLEDGDIIVIPEKTSVVMVHGEVRFPSAVIFNTNADLNYYIEQAGGFTQRANKQEILVIKQSGKIAMGPNVKIEPGDEIFVLPKIEAKRIEIVRGITQILYQIAVSARVLLMAW